MAQRPAVTSTTSYLLIKAGKLMAEAIDAALAASDLNNRQFLLLSIVSEQRAQSQLEVSRQLHLDPTIVVGLIDELEGRGLLTRRRHADDRRRYVLALTPDGTRTLRAAATRSAAVESAFVAELTAKDRDALREMLVRVVQPKLDQL